MSLTSSTLSRQRFYLLTLLSNELATCMLSQSTSPAWTSALIDCKVVLKPRKGYVPKMFSTPFRAQVVTHSAFTPCESAAGEEPTPLPLCPVCALRIYVKYTRQFRLSDQLFVCFGGRPKGLPGSKQRLSHWIVDAIALAYDSQMCRAP